MYTLHMDNQKKPSRSEIAAMGGRQKGKNYAAKRAMSEGAKTAMSKLSPEERSARAKKAAQARWGKK